MKTKLSIVALAAALLFAGLPVASSSAAVSVAIGIAPPPIPIYTQPYAPGPGYIWTPGYWAYSDFGYYWVPGVWVLPPRIGFLWTPGYWGYNGGRYAFYDGYWGPTVGYYGGINYGFGYVGSGYYGGRWDGGIFRYNTAVTRVNRNVITNTYVNNSFPRTTRSRASFNGPGGVKAERAGQPEVPKSQRIAPVREQRTVVEAAQKNPALHAKNNKGKPKAEAVESVRSKVNPDRAESGRGRNEQQGQAENRRTRNERQAQPENRGADANQAGARNEDRAERSARPERTKRGEQQANGANQAARERANRTDNRSGARTVERNTAPKVERSRSVAKPERTQRSARPAVKTRPTVERKAPSRPRTAVQRPQRAPQRQQATMKRRPQSGAVRKAPAQGQQQQPQKGKKKKRERPDGR